MPSFLASISSDLRIPCQYASAIDRIDAKVSTSSDRKTSMVRPGKLDLSLQGLQLVISILTKCATELGHRQTCPSERTPNPMFRRRLSRLPKKGDAKGLG